MPTLSSKYHALLKIRKNYLLALSLGVYLVTLLMLLSELDRQYYRLSTEHKTVTRRIHETTGNDDNSAIAHPGMLRGIRS